ncbi:MAG: hypothetical protein RL558_835 [Bacteroidota bacterium]
MEAANVFQTQEERLMVDAKAQVLRIGIPLESTWAENRVSLTPEGVHLLVAWSPPPGWLLDTATENTLRQERRLLPTAVLFLDALFWPRSRLRQNWSGP